MDYELMTTEELVEQVRTTHNDGAAYYLIMVTCRPLLCGIMNNAGVEDEIQYDMLMDFFLYLRDGNNKVEDSKMAFTYQLFLAIGVTAGKVSESVKKHIKSNFLNIFN